MTSTAGTDRKRGRPFADTVSPNVHGPAPQIAALDAWISGFGEPAPSRPEAVHRALAEHLTSTGCLTATDEKDGGR